MDPIEPLDTTVGSSRSNDLVCTRRGESQTRITVSDHGNSNWAVSAALLVKYGLMVLAALAFPFLIFKLFILPFKLLIGLKAMSFINSLLLGTLLYKFQDQSENNNNNYNGGIGGPYFPPGSGPIPGTNPGVSGTGISFIGSGSNDASGSIGSPFSVNKILNGDDNLSQDEDDEDNSDYVDVVGPDEDVKRILDMVRNRNKNW